MRRERGYSLLEVVFAIAIFGMLLFIFTALMTDFRHYERAYAINFMKHPQTIAVLARIRRDVIDAFGADPYPASFDERMTPDNPHPLHFEQSPRVLIVNSIQTTGFLQTIVWDFSTEAEAHRRAYTAGVLMSHWSAFGVPHFTVGTFEIPNRPYSVRLQATDKGGKLAIDQILQPRAHE